MNLPTLPGNNLYAFVAILGMLLVASGVYYPYVQMQQRISDIYELDAQAKKIELTINQMINNNVSTDSMVSFKTSIIDFMKDKNKFDAKKQQAGLSVLGGLISVLVGIVMFLFGVIRWYSKVQKPEDISRLKSIGS